MNRIITALSLAVIAAAPTLIRAQAPPGHVLETTDCLNGSSGGLLFIESPSSQLPGLSATPGFVSFGGSFGRVADCNSKTSFSILPSGACSVYSGLSLPQAVVVSTPSPTTPVMSFLDLGPEIRLGGPNGEIKATRSISGPGTSYGYSSRAPAGGFLTAGKYTLSFDGGRDVAAFHTEFDYVPLVLTRPAAGAVLNFQASPTLAWSGGNLAGTLYASVSLQSQDFRQFATIACRIPDDHSREFAIPSEFWNQLPTSLRLGGGTASISIGAPTATIVFSVPELDKGLHLTLPLQAQTNRVTAAP